MSQFHLSEQNPNDVVGGGGCLCHPDGGDETRGPFIIFTPTTVDEPLSPHAVLCEHCVGECAVALTPDAPPESPIEGEVIEDNPDIPADYEPPIIRI